MDLSPERGGVEGVLCGISSWELGLTRATFVSRLCFSVVTICGCDQLVNETTVVSLTREMLNYLVVAIPEHKAPLCSKIAAAADR